MEWLYRTARLGHSVRLGHGLVLCIVLMGRYMVYMVLAPLARRQQRCLSGELIGGRLGRPSGVLRRGDRSRDRKGHHRLMPPLGR